MKGSIKQNIEYCSKEEGKLSNFFSLNLDKYLKENPLTQLQRDCEENNSLINVYKDNFALSCKYHAFIQKYHGLQQKPRDHITSCVVITGPTGRGKTGQIRYNYDINEIYWKPHGQWWDGYNNQKVVVFDEFYSWYPYGDLLRLLDRYPLKVPIKGSFCEFNSEIVYITSNQHWNTWFPNIPDKSAFLRRMTVAIDMSLKIKRNVGMGPL
ncbi:replication-associated protein [Trichonephila clavata]|uniref:Replication-associated protein n=1 Tax=Trichonephila clavata TaxID=2740835 RepID=A0A8X6FRZ6_TRICU|nr:replication-associated protein [Trichonephila clavata]GFQ87102.1 replication-associated protein [Trichonephila clavata]